MIGFAKRRAGVLCALGLVAGGLAASGCRTVHPVHWTKMGVSAARGDAGAVRERMRLDPDAGEYVRMAESSTTDVWIESAIQSHDATALQQVLSTLPALNVKLPQSGKTPLALARQVRFDEGVRLLKAAGAKK